VTRQRIYLETMERVFGGTEKIILDSGSGGSGVVPYLPLNELGRSPSSQPRPQPQAQPQAGAAR
jgi:membrane protease subunit HflK